MKIRNLSFFVLLFSFLFLTSPFYQREMLHSNRGILIAQTPTPAPITSQTSNPLFNFFNWLFGLFNKTDYTITTRSLSERNSDMTNYGDKKDSAFPEKMAFGGSRSQSYNNQNCLKGNIIKKVVLGTDQNNTNLSKICVDSSGQCSIDPNSNDSSCKSITIKDLGHYFVQINEKFYCTSSNQLINIEQNLIDKINSIYQNDISSTELNCYLKIYNNSYLTPKNSTDENEENTKKMIQSPLSNKDQKDGSSNSDLQDQLNQNFSPDGSSSGLSGLRPERDK